MSIERAIQNLNINCLTKLNQEGEPILIDDESLFAKFLGTTWYFGETVNAGTGTLFVLTRRLVWVDDSTKRPFDLRYQQIIVHAMSQPQGSFNRHCVYLQLDGNEAKMDESGDQETDIDNSSDLEGDSGVEFDNEVRIVPSSEDEVKLIFKAMCSCAELNSDDDDDEDHEDEGKFFFNEDEVMNGLSDATRDAILAKSLNDAVIMEKSDDENSAEEDLEELVGMDPERFEDVE